MKTNRIVAALQGYAANEMGWGRAACTGLLMRDMDVLALLTRGDGEQLALAARIEGRQVVVSDECAADDFHRNANTPGTARLV